MTVKYPEITVRLTGQDGNAWNIMAICRRAARKAKLPAEEVDLLMDEMVQGDYDNLLQTVMRWFNVE